MYYRPFSLPYSNQYRIHQSNSSDLTTEEEVAVKILLLLKKSNNPKINALAHQNNPISEVLPHSANYPYSNTLSIQAADINTGIINFNSITRIIPPHRKPMYNPNIRLNNKNLFTCCYCSYAIDDPARLRHHKKLSHYHQEQSRFFATNRYVIPCKLPNIIIRVPMMTNNEQKSGNTELIKK